jgi:hypothetical protein
VGHDVSGKALEEGLAWCLVFGVADGTGAGERANQDVRRIEVASLYPGEVVLFRGTFLWPQ